MIVRMTNCVALMGIILGGFLAWGFVSPSLPGEEVPASIADTIRGGVNCIFASRNPNLMCPVAPLQSCGSDGTCLAQTYQSGTGSGTNFGLPPNNVCCGTTPASGCAAVSLTIPSCGSG